MIAPAPACLAHQLKADPPAISRQADVRTVSLWLPDYHLVWIVSYPTVARARAARSGYGAHDHLALVGPTLISASSAAEAARAAAAVRSCE